MGPVWVAGIIANVNLTIIFTIKLICCSDSLCFILSKVSFLLTCCRQAEDHFIEMYPMAAAVESLIWSREPKAKPLVLAAVDMPVKQPPPPFFVSFEIL